MDPLDPKTFFFDIPLYTDIIVRSEQVKSFLYLMNAGYKIDAYNPDLKQETTYTVARDTTYSTRATVADYVGMHRFTLKCVRDGFLIRVFVNVQDDDEVDNQYQYTLSKVGQLPSIADLHISKVREYDKVLSPDKIREFTRAIGLAANGVGIGSYVYLRRIFENLINEARFEARKQPEWDDLEFEKARMSEKIELLKNYLPDFLIEHRSIYSILSLGIHELNEKDCLNHFGSLKLGIEAILDEKVEKFEKERRRDEAKKAMEELKRKMGSK